MYIRNSNNKSPLDIHIRAMLKKNFIKNVAEWLTEHDDAITLLLRGGPRLGLATARAGPDCIWFFCVYYQIGWTRIFSWLHGAWTILFQCYSRLTVYEAIHMRTIRIRRLGGRPCAGSRDKFRERGALGCLSFCSPTKVWSIWPFVWKAWKYAPVVIGNTERHVRKASHCGSKQQQTTQSRLLLLARATLTSFCSSRTSPWWITHSTQCHRRGCNNIPPFLQRTTPIARSFCEGCTWHDLHILVTAPFCCDRKSRAACAQSFALWQQTPIEIMHCNLFCYCLLAPRLYIFVLHAHPVRGESHIQRNATGEVSTPLLCAVKIFCDANLVLQLP